MFETTGAYNIRLMEQRFLNFSTRYSVGMGDFLILRRDVFLFDIVQYFRIHPRNIVSTLYSR